MAFKMAKINCLEAIKENIKKVSLVALFQTVIQYIFFYVGLSNAILLAQNNEVWAVDIIKEKVDMINNKISPLVDKEIEEYIRDNLKYFYVYKHLFGLYFKKRILTKILDILDWFTILPICIACATF